MELVKAREMKRRIYAHDHLLTGTLWVGSDPESMEYKNCAKAFKNREKMTAEFNRLMGWKFSVSSNTEWEAWRTSEVLK